MLKMFFFDCLRRHNMFIDEDVIDVAFWTFSSCALTAFMIAVMTLGATLRPNPSRVRQYLGPLISMVCNEGLGMPDLESHWFIKRLAFLGQSLSRDTVWTQKVRETSPCLEGNPKAESCYRPSGEEPFLAECRMALHHHPGSSGRVGRVIHVLFQIRPRLIIVSFLVDKSFLWVFI